jgi:hypothetical protein
MAEYLTYELKNDMENMYKVTGDLLNMLEEKCFENVSKEVRDTLEEIKAELMDVAGTLQKDIFNCEYLLTKFDTMKHLQQEVLIGREKGSGSIQ